MRFLLAIPSVLSCLLLAAHFLRGGAYTIVALCLAAPLLLLVRRAWAVRAVQVILALGFAVWVLTAYAMVLQRIERGDGWLRMAIILGSVALFTALSARLLRVPRDTHAGGSPAAV